MATPVTVAHGDGIGPEIMEASLQILREAGAKLEIETIEIGKQVYERGVSSGIDESAWDSLQRTKLFYKAPITTPQGGGVKSLNVTVRKTLGLFANVRPCVAYAPFVNTRHPGMDVTIIRENEEDLYAGIEHRQTQQVYQCLKLISEPGSEKIVRYAFEYARANKRKKVTCFSKDNIMKLTDGVFHKVFDRIGEEYPEIEKEHYIIDIATARLADTPKYFDVIVTSNLYGDIVSDVAAQITGSVGLGGSSNIGENFSMFEAIHGSAPDISGKGIANPSGLLLAGVMMLVHIGQGKVASAIHNAWMKTLEDGVHTGDIASEEFTKQRVGTADFTKAVIERLGQVPSTLKPVEYADGVVGSVTPWKSSGKKAVKQLVGVDMFVDWSKGSANDLGTQLEGINTDALKLVMISNRGVKVYPHGHEATFCTDHWRCRFMGANGESVSHTDVIQLLTSANEKGFDFIKTEHLCTFGGEPGFSLGQGQ